jgi:hypothetical protein
MRRATGAEGVSVTAAASLEAVRAALREPRRTLTELGDGGPQGEQSLTPAGAPGAPVLSRQDAHSFRRHRFCRVSM